MLKTAIEQAAAKLLRQKLMCLLLVLLFAAGLFLIIGITGYYEQNETKLSSFYQVYGSDSRRISVVLNDVQGFRNATPEHTKAVADYYSAVMNSSEFSAYTFFDTTIYIKDYRGPDNCLYGYDRFLPNRDRYRQDGIIASIAKVFCMSPGFFDAFSLEVAEGRDFSDCPSEYTGQRIPIVMGWNYHDSYKVGDILQSWRIWDDSPVELEVTGFLPPDAAVLSMDNSDQTLLRLSDVILYPTFDLTQVELPDPVEHPRERAAQEFYLCDLCQFIIVTQDSSLDITAYGDFDILGPYFSKGIMVLTSSFLADANRYFDMLTLASVLIITGGCVCLILNLVNQMLSDLKMYAIHQLSGATLGSVIASMTAQVLIITLVAFAIAIVLALTVGKYVFTYNVAGVFGISVTKLSAVSVWSAVGISALVCVLSLIFPVYKLYTTEFDTLLRGRE